MPVDSKGVVRGLTVLNNSDGGVNLPVNAEAVIKRQTALEEFVKNFVKVGGKGKLQRDGKVYYTIFPKANLDRDVTTTSDGKIVTAGMYGTEGVTPGSAGSTFGYVAPTTVKAYEDFVELVGGKFMKEIITKREQELENLPTLATDRISTYQKGNAERIINEIKLAMVAAVGTVGKAATDAGWTPTNPRQIDKDYTVDEAGGLAAYNDIDEAISTILNIGRMGSAEENYPFARGSDGEDVTLAISRNVNRALTIAFKESPAGTFPGMTVDTKKGDVLNLFGCNVVKIEAMPAKANHAFNWLLITIGENGAIAMPSVFDLKFLIRPHYEGVTLLGDIIEGIGGTWGTKLFQPELIVGSFRATANAVPAGGNDEPETKAESFTLSDDEIIVSKKDLAKTKVALEEAKADKKVLEDLKAAQAKEKEKSDAIAKELKELKKSNTKALKDLAAKEAAEAKAAEALAANAGSEAEGSDNKTPE